MLNILLIQLYSELQPPNAEPFAIEVLAGALEVYCPGCQVQLMALNPAIHPDAVQQFIGEISQTGIYSLLGFSVPQGTMNLHEKFSLV